MNTDARSAGDSETDFFGDVASAASTSAGATRRATGAGARKATSTSRTASGTRKTAVTRPGRSTRIIVDEVVDPVELRKPPESIMIRNMGSGEISLLQRKAFNFLLQNAQQCNDPTRLTYEVPIRDFERAVGFKTKSNRQYLRQVARALMMVTVEFDYRSDSNKKRSPGWGVSTLIAEVFEVNDNVLGYSFAPEMSKRLLKPELFSRIDLNKQADFKSYSGLVLWEITSRYFGWQQCETIREKWEWWSINLSGTKTAHKQFRDFNKMLDRAIQVVNSNEDRFQITMHCTRNGHKIQNVWFEITATVQPRLALSEPVSDITNDLMKRLGNFGLSDQDVEEQVAKHGEDYLHAQADYLEARLRRKNGRPIVNQRAYYLTCCDKNAADAPVPGAVPVKTRAAKASPNESAGNNAKATLDAIYEKFKGFEIAKLREQFIALSPESQQKIIADIEGNLRKAKPIWDAYKKNGLNTLVINAVVTIAYERNAKRPSDMELYSYAVEHGVLKAAA
ncbi:RepB family plasmid replication initiator protein [Paraburkholderia youngii]|uniref:RepB family plasmid replication initiator protein n=1 Tax=Paraburkholderia youngii TaxID=2782701 RepID=UPI003D24DF5F